MTENAKIITARNMEKNNTSAMHYFNPTPYSINQSKNVKSSNDNNGNLNF